MPWFCRKSDPIVVDSTSAKKWKADPGAVRWTSTLKNENASAKSQAKSYGTSKPTASEVGAAAAAGHRWVAEEAEGLYNGRGRRGSRSTQMDGHGHGRVPFFARNGIWSARSPDMVSGRVDYGRWPETSIPPPGTPSSHDYGPPAWTQVRTGGGRDGCPGCPYC